MRKLSHLLLIAAFSATVLAGCGNKEPAADQDAAQTGQTEAEAKSTAEDAVKAAKEAAAASEAQAEETIEAIKNSTSDK